MKIRFPIYAQTSTFLALHLVLLLVLFLAIFNRQFGPGWDALLRSPLGDRVESIAWDISRRVRGRPQSEWNGVLDDAAKIYDVKFYIYDGQGKELAGEPLVPPAQVAARLVHHYHRGQESTASPALDTSASQAQPPPHNRGRFLIHTKDPDCFWIGVRVPLHESNQSGTAAAATAQLARGNSPRNVTVLVLSRNLWQSRIFFDFAIVIFAVASVLAFSLLLWCPFVYRITRELSILTAATEEIATGKFDLSLKSNDWDEIGSLSTSVNSMACRLKEFVTGQKRFLGDIAHELCSPIARLQVAMELLCESATPAQERYLNDIRIEVEEMKALIDELLSFSKAELAKSEPSQEAVPLQPIIDAVLARVATDVPVVLDVQPGLTALGNNKLIERAFSNIVSNAIRYAGHDGPIKIKALRQADEIAVICCDSGPGVPPESLQMLGEPFYRPEPSRSRASGGVGLGLAIVKSCIASCDGTVVVRNEQPHGLAVEIRLKVWSDDQAISGQSGQRATDLAEPQIG